MFAQFFSSLIPVVSAGSTQCCMPFGTCSSSLITFWSSFVLSEFNHSFDLIFNSFRRTDSTGANRIALRSMTERFSHNRASSNRRQTLIPFGFNRQITLAVFAPFKFPDDHLSFARDLDTKISPHRSLPS